MTHAAHIHTADEAREAAQPPPRRKNQEQFDTYDPSWKTLIQQCEAYQAQFKARRLLGKDWTDKQFTQGSTMPDSTWNLLKSGNHNVPETARSIGNVRSKLESLAARCAEVLNQERAEALKSSQLDVTSRFVPTSDYEAMKAAITNAQAKVEMRSEERLIIFIAPTRSGKTWLRDRLAEEGQVTWRMTGMPSWKHSYKYVLRDFADIFGVPYRDKDSAAALERDIKRKASTLTGVLWIQEVQYLCRQGQEFLKILLNETTLTLVMSMTPRAYETMRDFGGDEEDQTLARCEATLQAAPITAEWVRSYAAHLSLTAEQCATIAAAANERGARSLVREVCLTLARTGTGDSQVKDAIRLYRMAVPLINTRRVLSMLASKAA